MKTIAIRYLIGLRFENRKSLFFFEREVVANCEIAVVDSYGKSVWKKFFFFPAQSFPRFYLKCSYIWWVKVFVASFGKNFKFKKATGIVAK